MAERTGIAAVLAEAGAGEALEARLDDVEQLALALGLDTDRIRRRAAGRPAGRRNLRNQRVADYLLGQYPDPLEGLVRMAAMPLEALADALGCSRFEAAQEQRLCRIAALPYLHQRQAIAVDMTHRTQVELTIVDGLAADQVDDAATIDVLEYQEVSDAAE